MVEFTKRAKRVINEMAGEEAKRLGHDFVDYSEKKILLRSKS